ncbi:hypothetical protein [Streptomyces sp. NPDC051214]|uniref:hypothetical protein n=1 Tax=Streptomyces sp. NPDC051214 TaxID=3155282 RepID=UPI003422E23A
MKMTSDFAQAIAATAPIILLVGVVEMRSYAQVLTRQHENDRQASEPLLAEVDGASGERQAEIRAELGGMTRRAVLKAALPMGVSVFWVLISIVLAVVTYQSLYYLAEGAPEGSPELAHELLTSIMLGLVMLVAIPIATWFNAYFAVPLHTYTQWARERSRARRTATDGDAEQNQN